LESEVWQEFEEKLLKKLNDEENIKLGGEDSEDLKGK